jgi:hypothetical protein
MTHCKRNDPWWWIGKDRMWSIFYWAWLAVIALMYGVSFFIWTR